MDIGQLTPIDGIEVWIEAYTNRANGMHFMGHGRIVQLLREYAALRTHLQQSGQQQIAGNAQEIAVTNVHQVKLKTRKEMDRTIPRERLGWWYDVCPGQNMTLRDATASDLERCSIKQRSDKKPEHYLCELPENGSLIHRDALAHCRTFSIAALSQSDGERS